ncbi:hypothetical protein PHYC_03106 [Phycisphaerales bacterium]|nr:hypothetical protein PHYC_03106 [Phycisphaerales bacterium]
MLRLILALGCSAGLSASAVGQTIDPFFAGSYTLVDLGSAPDVPAQYGGLTLLAASSDVLLLGGAANSSVGALYAVSVTRDGQGHIDAFVPGATTLYASAEYNDGGVTYGPSGVLFASRWPVNQLGQYRPGSVAPDRVIDLAALGVAQSHSAVMFVPVGYSGAGRMKLCSWSGGQFYDAAYAPDGSGTFDVLSATQTATLGGGPEGFVYVPPGSPLFTGPSMLVSEYSAGSVAVYDVDPNGDPIVSSRRDFMVGLFGAEGAYIDPFTGDFLFSTFGGGSHVIVVHGFVPPPCDPDVNCDGALNGFDVEATEEAVNGNFTNFCFPDADLNGDGAVNGFDIETEEQRVNGEPC